MNEMMKRFIDKEVIITTLNNDISMLEGFVREVNENWLVVETNEKGLDVVNVDYIIRIREYPRKPNGKKKTIFS
ncbi:MAG: hypothetical protein IJZ72_01520 [Oscillospiraceae bacterium]|nr:hypothetical protein [Oscillospiraceae bacterium]